MSTTEENKAVVRGTIDLLNKGDYTGLDQFFTPNFVDHSRPGANGVESVKQLFTMLHNAIPDLLIEINDTISQDDKVVNRITITGTQHGDLMGIPATGKKVVISAIEILRFVEGKTAERWANQDDLGMLQQLGVIPAPQQASATA